MSCTNGMGLDMTSTPHDNLHLEDFRFTDLKWAKSSRMSKRWLVFFVRIKVRLPTGTPSSDAVLHARGGTCCIALTKQRRWCTSHYCTESRVDDVAAKWTARSQYGTY